MGVTASHLYSQSVFLPKPLLTEENLPDQAGRVCIITGGYAGVGEQLSRIIYEKNGTVYIAGRSAEKAEKALERIKKAVPSSKGKLEFLHLDLSDLTTIKSAVETFSRKETRLDVLVNNAGVMFPPHGSKAKQGQELQIGTNCVGPFLLTQLLTPLLEKTAASSPAGSVRIAWAGSLGVDMLSPKGGVQFTASGDHSPHKRRPEYNYGASKAGNYFLSSQYAKRHPIGADGKGVVSVAFNPGNLQTELQRHTPAWQLIFLKGILFPAVYGAYTELWSGWSEEVKPENNGQYVWPWGRFGPVRPDVEKELKDGGNAEKLWKWCEAETKEFA